MRLWTLRREKITRASCIALAFWSVFFVVQDIWSYVIPLDVHMVGKKDLGYSICMLNNISCLYLIEIGSSMCTRHCLFMSEANSRDQTQRTSLTLLCRP